MWVQLEEVTRKSKEVSENKDRRVVAAVFAESNFNVLATQLSYP